ARAAGLSGEVEQQLFDALQRKAIDEVITLTEGLPADLSGMLRALVDLCGGCEVLSAARERLANAPAPVLAALGGMAGPAAVYLLLSGVIGAPHEGWPIPLATDIAFALAIF
ncbi:Na+/H+ antiporter NhaA, partial [Mesorhizobium japonicum]|uniref:Na+/H+ antiporter NhaA n=1 Tax=Mesorhizobium japonicum TaxID=2066070 RepID=UPI003B598A6E